MINSISVTTKSKIIFLYLICVFFGVQGANGQQKKLVDYVNPFIGTDANGHTFPGAALPFGMVQLSPDTDVKDWDHSSGYHYGDKTIMGFSQTHLSGTGCPGYGNILVMPTTGLLQVKPGTDKNPETGYRSRYHHQSEEASPNYYQVVLEDGIKVELTATMHAGFHRYTFPQSEKANLIFDISHSLTESKNASVKILNQSQIAGSVSSGNMCGKSTPFTLYFFAKVQKPSASAGTFKNGNASPNLKKISGMKNTGAFLQYSMAKQGQLLVKVGISFVSIDGARKNLQTEIPGWNFDRIRKAGENMWEDKLSKIHVVEGSEKNKIKFYTALYHTLLFPRTFSDVDGSYYSHFTDSVYTKPGFTYYTDFSLWDTYRATHPLFTIIEPERQTDMIKTLLAMYDQGGHLPLGVSYMNHYMDDVMIGDHAVSIIADSYLKGIKNYDVQKAYNAMKFNAMIPDKKKKGRSGLVYYKKLGYVPAKIPESVSKTLEYAYDDWCIARMAKALGKEEDYEKFYKRSKYYRNLYDSTTGFMRPRLANGKWESPFDPLSTPTDYSKRDYTEANAWQYLWYVPQDIPGLAQLMGGNKNFSARLDTLFKTKPTDLKENGGIADMSGFIGQYVHGNEPDQQTPYLYNYVGNAWKAQDRVRFILNNLYSVREDGLPGNDDMGQMSAWFVFGAMGFYPATPASSVYQIGSPLFKKVVIDLGKYYGNNKFTIIAYNNSGDNKYIQSARLNGKLLYQSWITHREIVEGGKLVLRMGSSPRKQWGD